MSEFWRENITCLFTFFLLKWSSLNKKDDIILFFPSLETDLKPTLSYLLNIPDITALDQITLGKIIKK